MAGVIVGALALGFAAISWLAHGWIEADGELTREKTETVRQKNRADNESTRAHISEFVLPLAGEGGANAARIEKIEDDLETYERLDRLESQVDHLSR